MIAYAKDVVILISGIFPTVISKTLKQVLMKLSKLIQTKINLILFSIRIKKAETDTITLPIIIIFI